MRKCKLRSGVNGQGGVKKFVKQGLDLPFW